MGWCRLPGRPLPPPPWPPGGFGGASCAPRWKPGCYVLGNRAFMLVLRLGDEAHLPRDASGSFRTPLGATDVVTGPLALTPVCPQLGCAWGPSVFGAGVPPSSSRWNSRVVTEAGLQVRCAHSWGVGPALPAPVTPGTPWPSLRRVQSCSLRTCQRKSPGPGFRAGPGSDPRPRPARPADRKSRAAGW